MHGSGEYPDLYLADVNEAVRELQACLIALGLDPGSRDGHLGERTAAAVSEFELVFHVVRDDLRPERPVVDATVWTAVLQHLSGQRATDRAEGTLSEDQAWIWHDGTWHPAQPAYSEDAGGPSPNPGYTEHVSEDGHWRWVDGEWRPNR